MSVKLELLKEARAIRNLASKTLKQAAQASASVDKEHLRAQAEALLLMAADLEQRASSLMDAPFF
jgi:hypothetical protein